MSFQPIGSPAQRVGDRLTDRLRADAEQLAADYDYDVDALRFQWERRQFGSFTTTLAGSPEQRDRYKRAWEIAVNRREAAKRRKFGDDLLDDIHRISRILYGVE